jgi:hypothetical protein
VVMVRILVCLVRHLSVVVPSVLLRSAE